MSTRNVVLAALIGLVILTILVLIYEKEQIEQVLRSNTQEVLEENQAEISIDQVFFDGRDIVLQGSISSLEEKRRVERLISDVWDVRLVNNQLHLYEDHIVNGQGEGDSEAIDSTDMESGPLEKVARFELEYVEEKVVSISGVFSDSVMQGRVIDIVKSSFPGFEVQDAIEVDTTIALPNWYEALLALMPTVGLVNKPVLDVAQNARAFNLSGEVFGNIQRQVIAADATKALGDSLGLNTSLVVAETDDSPEDVRIATLKARIQNLLATTRVQFALNTADLMAESMNVLNDIAVLLNEAPDIQVEIQGHTDNTGSSAINRALSQVRAESVRSYLIQRGVSPSRLTAVGYGPARPIATNFTYEGRVTNRRVEFSLKGGS